MNFLYSAPLVRVVVAKPGQTETMHPANSTRGAAPWLETPRTFVSAMAGAATAVSIVTTDGPAGRFGITVSAVASVSAEPPMVLACIDRRSPAAAAIERNGSFCINMLNAGQSALANRFAGRPDDGAPYDFGSAHWRTAATGAPVLDGAVAAFDCVLESGHDAGTHRIVIGQVASAVSSPHPPLAYARRTYQALSALGDPSRPEERQVP
jgi:flavin reductase